ncbi:hypothetical protein [Amnibacterium sp.]|uniref:hypothetical protein n=1 Tax=Amnibacterium sp. TaxID=1872496 RepID=UPI003F7C2A1F
MPDAPRLITLTLELRYDTTPDEQAVFDGDDEAAQAELDQAVLRNVLGLLDESGFGTSRFRLGTTKGSTGSSWINRFHS